MNNNNLEFELRCVIVLKDVIYLSVLKKKCYLEICNSHIFGYLWL